jgi:hypothetical protein
MVLSLMLTGCPTDDGGESENPPGGEGSKGSQGDEFIDGKHVPYGAPPYTGGPLEGAVNITIPEHGASTVKISLILKDGYITEVDLSGSGYQTPGLGTNVIIQAPEIIIATNSVEIKPDAITGPSASITRLGVRDAGKQALNKIPGVDL